MIGALKRVFRAPGLVLTVAAVQLTVAAVLGSSVQTAVAATMGRFAVVADGHMLYSMVSLFVDNPGVAAGARDLLAGSALLALGLWTLLAAGIIHRLSAPAPASEVAAAAVRGLPAMIVVTLWQLLPRLILIALVGGLSAKLLSADTWGWLGFAPLLAVLGYVTCALDLARCDVVLHGARRFHLMTALGGFATALRRPGVLLPSMVLTACQWGCVAAILAVSISGLGTGHAIWFARGLAVLGVVFGLARVAVAVGTPAQVPVVETTGYPRPSLRDEDPPDQDPPARTFESLERVGWISR
ncbi:MAG: hypothetical protein V3T72_01475 [Thermoanaerobaculia bacterium]